jgi:secreted trypsin-like serine protease
MKINSSLATLATLALACGLRTDASSEAIVDGADASGPEFDAIGTIGDLLYETSYDPKCTATLIEPRLIMTAAHCLRDYVSSPVRRLVFALGADAHAPTATIGIRSTAFDAPSTGGFGSLGRDVAFATLDHAVTQVRPIALASAPLTENAVRAVGFGISDVKTRAAGKRLQGTATIRAREGAPLAKLHGNFAALFAFVERAHGRDFAGRNRVDLEAQFQRRLESGMELYVGGTARDAQTCSGDSGSPLLMMQNGALVAVAVASFSYKGREASVTCSSLGQTYSMPSDAAKRAARENLKR